MSVSPQDLERQLAERHKPLLVLYPEISTEQRAHRERWREEDKAPLLADYYPRDLGMVFDHACARGGVARTDPSHDRPRVLDALGANACERIDVIDGVGHADRDAFWAAYYRIMNNVTPHERDEAYPLRAYAHVAYGQDLPEASGYASLIAIEYWMFYLYNDWKSTHEGDWELVIVYLRQPDDASLPPHPIACAYSAHHGGFRQPWAHVWKTDDNKAPGASGTHPIVYVANGSHANYFHGPGSYHTTTEVFGARITSGEFPFTGSFVDYTTSLKERTGEFPEVQLVPPAENGRWAGDWRWLNFTGEWGSSGVPPLLALPLRLVPKRYRFDLQRRVWGAPASLPPRRNWRDPFSWADNECQEAPVPGSWLSAH